MSKPKTKTPAEYEKWSNDLTKMRIRNAHQLAEMKAHKARVAMKKRLEEEKKEIEKHKEYIKSIHESAAKKKHGGRRTRRR